MQIVKLGRPPKYTPEEIQRIQGLLNQYINDTEIPIIKEFCYLHNVSRDDIYNYDEFESLRVKAMDKKEAQLEKLGLEGKINPAMAIFSLKQLGWSNEPQPEPADTVIKVTITE
jgi:hypothetical protein